MRGAGGALFAGIVLMVVGVLNIVYGIAAVSDSKFYVEDTHYVFSTLHTWGWIAIILGAIEVADSRPASAIRCAVLLMPWLPLVLARREERRPVLDGGKSGS